MGRVLALGAGRDWVGVIGRRMRQDGGAGWSWSARRTIATGSVLVQMPTTAAPASAPPAIPLPTSISRDRGKVVQKAPKFAPPDYKQMAEEWRESMRRGRLQCQMTRNQRAQYAKYLETLQDNGIVTEYLRWAFGVFHGSYDHNEYAPWIILLETLFPKAHGFRVVQTYYSPAEKRAKQPIQPLIGVRKQEYDGSWPLVLLALGCGRQDPRQLEARFPSVVAAGASRAQRIMQEEGSCGSMVLLAFCAEALLWHTLRAGSAPQRRALLPDVRDKAAEATLLEIVALVRALEMY